MSEVIEILQRIEAKIDSLTGVTESGPSAEQIRQKNLYSDILAKRKELSPDYDWDAEEVKLQKNFPVELRHPDLKLVPAVLISLRTTGLPSLLNGVAQEDTVGWYGGLYRDSEQTLQGMYATKAQAAAWPYRVQNDIVIGPS